MPLLIHNTLPCVVLKIDIFTFHYASTYTEYLDEYFDDDFIYIPLCLYLYEEGYKLKVVSV